MNFSLLTGSGGLITTNNPIKPNKNQLFLHFVKINCLLFMCVDCIKYLFSIILVIALTQACSSSETPIMSETSFDTDTMNWETDLCSKSGSFDTKKYKKTELYNTLALLNRYYNGSNLNTKSIVFDYKDISNLDSMALELEYTTLKNRFQSMSIIQQMPWIKLKQTIMNALKEDYDIKRTEMMAYRYPEVLLSHPYSAGCPEMVEALYNLDTFYIFEAWRNLKINQSKKNADPQRILDEYQFQNKLPERLEIAKTELITFGWPCKDRFNDLNDYNLYEEAFDRLFLSVRMECSEP